MGVQEAVDLFRAFVKELPAVFTADFSKSLHNLSTCLSDLGRTEEVMMAVHRFRGSGSVPDFRGSRRSAVFTADLGKSLHNLCTCLSDLGRANSKDAMMAVQEAVHLYRTLAAESRPGLYRKDLADSLEWISTVTVGQCRFIPMASP